MKAPTNVASAARARIRDEIDQIRHSVTVIAEGRPGDAEPDRARREQVYQARTGSPLSEARRRVSRPGEGQERIFGKTVDFVDVAFFERGRLTARSVVRIISRDGVAIGTGFLISPHVLMTNNHVLATKAGAADLLAEFDYERDLNGNPLRTTRFELDAGACFLTNDEDALDYTIVALGKRVSGDKNLRDFGCIPVSNARNKHQLGDFVNLIQHPDGRMKEAVLRENQLVARSGTTLHYLADTEPGSSGSPVLNVKFELVALHHWGSPHLELTDANGKLIPKSVNEGVRASSIYSDMATLRDSLDPGARKYIDEALKIGLNGPGPVGTEAATGTAVRQPAESGGEAASFSISDDGTATWQLPLSVSVRLGSAARALLGSAPPEGAPPSDAPTESAGGREAKLELDPDFDHRSGYRANFLGNDALPLPKLSTAQKKVAAKNKEAKTGQDPYELKYHHFSVVMNGKRRLAFFSAVNIDGAESKDYDRTTGKITDPHDDEDEGGEEGAELWFSEGRIEDDQQTPRDFYQGQTAFDAQGNAIEDKRTAGHRNRMFQQGHLTRRQDPIWGDDPDLLKFANSDTFHVTNCAPQVGFFNMGVAKSKSEALDGAGEAKKPYHPGGQLYWRALEDYVLNNARADRSRVSVFTGPIFDAEDYDWDRGRPDMKGFKAPRRYWKLILRKEKSKLVATSLVADQGPLIDYLPEAVRRGEAEIARVPYETIAHYHASVAELENLTGLSFGTKVRNADSYVKGPGSESKMRKVQTIGEIVGKDAKPKPASKKAAKKAAKKAKKATKKAAAKKAAAKKK